MIELQFQQAVMDMMFRGDKWTEPVMSTLDNNGKHVHDGQAEEQKRQGYAERRIYFLCQNNRQKPQGKSKKLTTPVAHEYPCRISVVAQKTEHSTQGCH